MLRLWIMLLMLPDLMVRRLCYTEVSGTVPGTVPRPVPNQTPAGERCPERPNRSTSYAQQVVLRSERASGGSLHRGRPIWWPLAAWICDMRRLGRVRLEHLAIADPRSSRSRAGEELKQFLVSLFSGL